MTKKMELGSDRVLYEFCITERAARCLPVSNIHPLKLTFVLVTRLRGIEA